MKTKWASHSRNSNLTINTLMKYLPEDLIHYITYHEIAHAIERKHNENFWDIINKKIQRRHKQRKRPTNLLVSNPKSIKAHMTKERIQQRGITFQSLAEGI